MPGGLLKLCVRLLPIFIAQCKGKPPLPGGLLKLCVRLLLTVQLSVRAVANSAYGVISCVRV